jgi:hypothetical protein
MLAELKSYRNLGTPQFFFELIEFLKYDVKNELTAAKIQKLFFNRIIDGKSIFDGCVALAIEIKVVECNSEGTLLISDAVAGTLNDKDEFIDQFVVHLISALKYDEKCFEIFSPNNISYDFISQSIKITNNAFGLKYTNFKQLLIDFGVLESRLTEFSSYYIFSKKYINLFQKELLSEIKRRALSPEHLKLILDKQLENGEEAEEFVFNYEQKRLNYKNGLVWVAQYSVSEGYDIASYDTEESLLNDRFIEVKSYSGSTSFYWSRNEIEVSSTKGKRYFLYLVNRAQLNNPDYIPTIIQNPYENVLKDSGWEKQIENYFISRTAASITTS